MADEIIHKNSSKIYYVNYDYKENLDNDDINIYHVNRNNKLGYACLYCIHKDESIENVNLIGKLPINNDYNLMNYVCRPSIEVDFAIKENSVLVLDGNPEYVISEIKGHGKMKLLWVYLYYQEK